MNKANLIYKCLTEQKRIIALHKKLGSEINEEEIKKSIEDKHMIEWKELWKLNMIYNEACLEFHGMTKTNWFWITVRPKPEIELKTFLQHVNKYLQRNCIKIYRMTLEQACEEGSGIGFHMHAVIDATWTGKAEALRETQSSFNKVADKNCVQIENTRNPHEMFNRYCIEYLCDDHDKECTKNGDAIWRAKHNIKSEYSSIEERFSLATIKSGVARDESIKPFVVELS